MSFNNDVEEHLNILDEVRKCFESKEQSLTYSMFVDSMRSCHIILDSPQARDFLNGHFHNIISILLSQSPKMMDNTVRTCIEEATIYGIRIILKLMKNDVSTAYISTLEKIFDINNKFYLGVKVNYQTFQGYPQIRLKFIQNFATGGGFKMLANYLKSSDEWKGCNFYSIILSSISSIFDISSNSIVDQSTIDDIVDCIKSQVLKLPDEQIKKEKDHMNSLIHSICSLYSILTPSRTKIESNLLFNSFWLEYTLKMITRESFILKLLGWDQLHEIIRQAYNTKPFAQDFMVDGAGHDFVNGIYKFACKEPNKPVMRYTKEPVNASEPFLTLMQCNMSKGMKWWFLSEAGKFKPGTDEDIDYYQNKCSEENEREPPRFGWNIASKIPKNNDTAPCLTPIGEIIPEGMTPDDFLFHKLPKWVIEHDIMGQLFGSSSVHREIISRSVKLVKMLADCNLLTPDLLNLMWTSVTNSHDVDTTEEILLLLSNLLPSLENDLFCSLIDLIHATLETNDNSNFIKISQFLDKFTHDKFNTVHDFNSVTSSKFLSLLWTMYKNPNFENLKNYHSLQELLGKCLSQHDGYNMSLESVRDCACTLHGYALTTLAFFETPPVSPSRSTSSPTSGSSNSTPSSPSSKSLAGIDETEASRIIKTLNFLISHIVGRDGIFELNSQDGMSIPGIIVQDIARFTIANRPRLNNNHIESKWYSNQISIRLKVLRQFYGIHTSVTITKTILQKLWELLAKNNNSIELNEFLHFLNKGCTDLSKYHMMCESSDFIYIFTAYICDKDINWNECNNKSLECFISFYNKIEEHFSYNTSDPNLKTIQLDALWRIYLEIEQEDLVKNTSQLILKAYDSINSYSINSHTDTNVQYDGRVLMIKKIMLILQECKDNSEISPMKSIAYSRCIDLLYESIIECKKIDISPSHSARGSMNRVNLKINYRKKTKYSSSNQVSKYDTSRCVIDKGSEGRIDIELHPYQSINDLKRIISEKVKGFSKISQLSIEKNNFNYENHSRLIKLAPFDDGDIYASLTSSFYQNDFNNHIYDNHMIDFHDVGVLISLNNEMFESLLSISKIINNEVISKKIWDVLMMIPTQPALLSSISNGIGDVDADTCDEDLSIMWSNLIGSSLNPFEITYKLQIIDNLLQPNPELMNYEVKNNSERFKNYFLNTKGYKVILDMLRDTPSMDQSEVKDRFINRHTLSVSLHILHNLLFGVENEFSYSNQLDNSIDSTSYSSSLPYVLPEQLLSEMQGSSSIIVEKLLSIASDAAESEQSNAVRDALSIITLLLKSSAIISQQLINNPQSKTLLATVLKSSSKTVRELSSDFAIEIGRSQPVVFKWLLNELEDIDHTDETCSDIFRALGVLVIELNTIPDAINLPELAELLSSRLMKYPRECQPFSDERQVLLGYLILLEKLINIDVKVVINTELGSNFEEIFMSDFLFTIPTNEQDRRPICDTPIVKKAAFSVLSSLLSKSENSFESVLKKITLLSYQTSNEMKRRNTWGLQVSHDMKKDNVEYTGLKNQGCTCYMNSLLQNLFMSTNFRETILNTNLKDSHRTSLWHKAPEDLIDLEILLEWSNNEWRKGKILSYEAETQEHTLGYYELNGNCTEMVSINIHEGRQNKETGRVKMYSNEGDEPLTEREIAAHYVLEQLQRTFCFMKHSKKRYFDPRPFVDACKTLNMNFSVYQQNDACEFFDQLLDRIELATKGKHTKQQVWDHKMVKNVFGGTLQYQKIPTDCERYKENKKTCGHWQSTREENLLKIELPLRGKDKIVDSLEAVCDAELMDGENKVDCDVCTNKMATLRRTCLGNLPNLLVLTIKRFDLDFQTFETVKLNSRLAFETHLNMLPYTKEGMELEEHKEYLRQQENIPLGGTGLRERSISISYDRDEYVAPDVDDFEYELQGVLVHAGIAQGGHYYSFVSDDVIDDDKSWFKFDDEDITAFDPRHIPAQCYGGPPSANGNGNHTHDEDRTSNALMLFYKKVRPNENKDDKVTIGKDKDDNIDDITTSIAQTSISANSVAAADDSYITTQSSTSNGSDLVNGYQGFIREVQESNLQHILYCYLLDSNMHIFVRGLIRSVTMASKKSISNEIISSNLNIIDDINQFDSELSYHFDWSPNESNPEIAKKLVQFGITFLLDVVLHCRERGAMTQWVAVIKEAFITFPDTAKCFIYELIKNHCNSWMNDYLLFCSDQSAIQTFIQLVFAAVQVIAPKTDENLVKNIKLPKEERLKRVYNIDINSKLVYPASNTSPVCDNSLLLSCLYLELMEKLWLVPMYVKYDEIFVLIRDLASIPSLNSTMIQFYMISYLSFFIMPNNVNDQIRSKFTIKQSKNNNRNLDYFPMLHQSIYEAIASILGVPQVRKVTLYIEKSYYGDTELVEDARRALTIIFNEISHNNGLSVDDIINFKIRTTQSRITAQHAKLVLDKFSHNNDGRMNLNGFLEYYTEQSLYHQQEVWRDLHAYGFRNDLSRSGDQSDYIDPFVNSKLNIQAICKTCLESFQFYSSGLDVSSASSIAIVKRVCYEDPNSSKNIIIQTLDRLHSLCREWNWTSSMSNIIFDFLFSLLSIEDNYIMSRMKDIFINYESGSILIVAINEKKNFTNCQANQHDKHTFLRRYIEIIQKFCVLPKFVEYVTELAEKYEQVASITRMLKLRPGLDLTGEEEITIKTAVIYVDGAAVQECNGEYFYYDVDTVHGCGYYRKRTQLQDGTYAYYWIYKYHNTSFSFWFISRAKGEEKPGKATDIDFYVADFSKKHEKFSYMPPIKGWRITPGKADGVDPAPSISWKADGLPLIGTITSTDYSSGGASSDSDDEMNDTYSNNSSSPSSRNIYH